MDATGTCVGEHGHDVGQRRANAGRAALAGRRSERRGRHSHRRGHFHDQLRRRLARPGRAAVAVDNADHSPGSCPRRWSPMVEPADRRSASTSTGTPTIPVSPTNGALTAAAIQQAFLSTMQGYLVPLDDSIGHAGGPESPQTTTSSVKVIVTPVKTADDPNGLRTFDITFTGDRRTRTCRNW